MSYITCYEYETNVNPTLSRIHMTTKNINDCHYGINFINFSKIYNVDYKYTSPNLLASFIKIEENGEYISRDSNLSLNGSSHLFYIIEDRCDFIVDSETFSLSSGDIFISPVFHSVLILIPQFSNLYKTLFFIDLFC